MQIALAGNPNAGKTTLFNALTGSRQFVGNWPGVTVEKKEGILLGYDDVIVVDLPGVYSLSPYTPEELVSRKYLADERPDVILNIVDGSNLERNLYLTTQLMELGIPVVVAINMMDVVKKRGDILNSAELAKRLHCEVVELSALKENGVKETAARAVAAKDMPTLPLRCFPGGVEHALAHIEEYILHEFPDEKQRWFAIKLFERDEKVREELGLSEARLSHIEQDIKVCELEMDDDAESIVISARYRYIDDIMAACFVRKNAREQEISQKIDRIVTHRGWALPIFAAVMVLVYAISVGTVGAQLSTWVGEGIFGAGFSLFGLWIPGLPVLIGHGLTALHCAAWLQSLVIDGILAGAGTVLAFLPQMMLLFFCLAFLEACGYMSRIAFILDRVFRKFGLSGKSFIPMLISSGCGVPGIMASRTIEREQDRRMTIMTVTFIPCGAKLPMIALLAGAIFGGAWWVAPSAYFVGIAAVLVSGLLLKRTKLFAGKESPFVMELPAYHLPMAKNVLRSMWDRSWDFIQKAGTIILLSSIVIWFASHFGWVNGTFGLLDSTDLAHSILADIGAAVSWIFMPLGWGNWQATVAMLTGLLAKENVVSTLGILYGAGSATALQAAFTPAAAYSFLLFNLLCAPCAAAVSAIYREMQSKRWFFLAIGYQTIFAYLVALVSYQAFRSGIGTAIGIALVLLLIVFAVRSIRKKKNPLGCGGNCDACAGCGGNQTIPKK